MIIQWLSGTVCLFFTSAERHWELPLWICSGSLLERCIFVFKYSWTQRRGQVRNVIAHNPGTWRQTAKPLMLCSIDISSDTHQTLMTNLLFYWLGCSRAERLRHCMPEKIPRRPQMLPEGIFTVTVWNVNMFDLAIFTYWHFQLFPDR